MINVEAPLLIYKLCIHKLHQPAPADLLHNIIIIVHMFRDAETTSTIFALLSRVSPARQSEKSSKWDLYYMGKWYFDRKKSRCLTWFSGYVLLSLNAKLTELATPVTLSKGNLGRAGCLLRQRENGTWGASVSARKGRHWCGRGRTLHGRAVCPRTNAPPQGVDALSGLPWVTEKPPTESFPVRWLL